MASRFLGFYLKHLSTRYQFALIFFVLLCLYYPVLFAPFNSIDDLKMVQYFLNVETISMQQLFFSQGSGQYYRPLLFLTFVLDNAAWGLQASFMHLENILLHIGVALLLFVFVRRIVQLQQFDAFWLPLVAALLFGLHPIVTEPVNWVSGRTDVLAGFFVLASVVCFLTSSYQSSVWRGAAGALLLLAGCLSKETALFMLPLLLLWCLLPPRDLPVQTTIKFRMLLFGMYLCSGIVYLTMRWSALSGGDKIVAAVAGSTSSGGTAFTLWDIVRVALKACGFYFKKLIIPVPLNFGIVEISPYYLWLGGAVAFGLVLCLYFRTLISYLLLGSFSLVAPALILPLLKITWTPIAERYVYMASAFFVVASVLLFVKYLQPYLSMRVVTLLVALLLGVTGTVTAQRNIVWKDNLTLFEDTVRKSPNFPAAKNELAIALHGQGRTQEAHALLLANSGDDFQPSTLNKVRVYLNQGKLEEAQKLLLKRHESLVDHESLMLLDFLHEARLKQSDKLEQKKIWQEMVSTLQSLEKITGDPFYHYRIGSVQLSLGEIAAAKESFTRAWQKSSPGSHYHDAARKLAERL